MRRFPWALLAFAGAAAVGNGQAPDDRPHVLPVTTLTPTDIASAKPIRQAAARDVPAATDPLPPPAVAPLPCPAEPPALIERLGTYYNNGFVLMESSDPERIPFKLVVANFAQMRYTNTQLESLTYEDHLGVVRRVDPRNDISFNRDLLTFFGYAFDPKLKYNVIVWSSGSLASVVVAGGITYEFNKAFALNAGYNALPGSRSLLGGFRDLAGVDRSMADTFFRPGFTQGSGRQGSRWKTCTRT